MMNGDDILDNVRRFLKSIPPGFKFRPDDDQIVVHYLRNKILKQPLPINMIYEVDFYEKPPFQLAAEYECNGYDVWYFFSQRKRKYRNGERPDRAAGYGYWKASGTDKPVKHNQTEVGFKRSLVYYQGKPPQGEKTGWLMKEYTIEKPRKRKRSEPDDMKLKDWVFCKLYYKEGKNAKNKDEEQVGQMQNGCDGEEEGVMRCDDLQAVVLSCNRRSQMRNYEIEPAASDYNRQSQMRNSEIEPAASDCIRQSQMRNDVIEPGASDCNRHNQMMNHEMEAAASNCNGQSEMMNKEMEAGASDTAPESQSESNDADQYFDYSGYDRHQRLRQSPS